jgi:hypothetical protein
LNAAHQQELDTIAEELFYYVNEIWIIKDILDTIDKDFGIASPYLNFRDALFHYNKMYDAAQQNDTVTFIQQQACIQEHLNRGLKDFAVHLCANLLTKILYKMIATKARAVNTVTIPKLRHIYHNIKNTILDIRLEGQTLLHFNSNTNPWLAKMVGNIGAFTSLLAEYPALKQLHRNTIKELVKNDWN